MRVRRRTFLTPVSALAALLLAGVALGSCALSGGTAGPSASPLTTGRVADASSAAAWTASPGATVTPTTRPTATPSDFAFVPIDLFAVPTSPPAVGALPTDQVDSPAPRRPVPAQSAEWLRLKAAGRIALVDGRTVVLDRTSDPFLNPGSGKAVEATSLLDTSYSRWIIEPLGYGKDAKGNTYSDKNFWNLCEAGATTAALYYWQQLTGRPDVTGTAGYFLDPYEAEGAAWPSGPRVAVSDGHRIGTYWSGSDAIDGYTAHARGYIAYIGMALRLPGWESTGEAVYADSAGKPLYPTIGAPRTNIQAALNWEASGRAVEAWAEFWYTSVMRFEPTMARDLRMAVMLDVGRDGVPVVAELDTHDLPNWQAGSATPHIRHSVAIVGYDNTASPPTYSYLDTCGRACNARGGNENGQVHVIAQSEMVSAIQDTVGSGFVW